jgi:hypothetical protein
LIPERADSHAMAPSFPQCPATDSTFDKDSVTSAPDPAETTGGVPSLISPGISLRMAATLLLYLREQKHPATHRESRLITSMQVPP